MVWETWRILQNGWVERHFSGKEFYFTYWPLDFVQPWPGDGMYVHLALMGVFAAFIALGFLYRVSAACFFLMFAYVFLLEKARYLNHLYLVCLLSALLAVLPAHRCWSVDALLRPRAALGHRAGVDVVAAAVSGRRPHVLRGSGQAEPRTG